MTIFDILFILCFLSALLVLISAAISALRGKQAEALPKLRALGICSVTYMAIVLAAALALPRKVYRLEETRCFDDWCIAVASFTRTPKSVAVALRLSSRAKRVPQGEKGTVVYLIDSSGNRYDPAPDSSIIPFDSLLQPGESVIATRRFDVPSKVGALGLIYTHEGGFPIESFIIGENTWFHGPPVVQLQ